jgi:uncharacterized 2Fe-2S/4Fe-4S cluster protein (DUF4445 family)/ferredoxin
MPMSERIVSRARSGPLPTIDIVLPSGSERIFPSDGEPGTSLAELLARGGHPLNTRCGRGSRCDGCVVRLHNGSVVHRSSGRQVDANGHPRSIRACEYAPLDGIALQIEVPERSLLRRLPHVVSQFQLSVPAGNDPLVATPALEDLGAAIDVGTTTVAILLVRLATGEIIGRATNFNAQVQHGADVLTRINLCRNDGAMTGTLRTSVIDQTLVPLLKSAAAEANADLKHLRCMAVAGNTTMLHLVAGEDPSDLGIVPFTPRFLDHRELRISELSLFAPAAAVHLLPGCSAYVGADLAAGAVASGLFYDAGPSLLVDIGTNGEIILKSGDDFYGCATAAGPAFEGVGMSCGTYAGEGAVSHLRLSTSPFGIEMNVIGAAGAKAMGICGSAYIDFLAEGIRSGLLTATGRFDLDRVSNADAYITRSEAGRVLQLAEDLSISELDISKLLQAKAAIAAGIETLLRRAGLEARQVKTLHLAGGFGMHIDIDSAIACGLLPGFTRGQIRVVGNTSLAGAYLALLDKSAIHEMRQLRRRMTIVELNQDPSFESCYIDHLQLGDVHVC